LCKNGRLKDAQEVVEGRLGKGYNLNVYTYTAIIHGFCSNGLLDEALATLSKMKDNCCIPNAVTYEIIIHFLFDKDENDKAEKFLREMILRGML
jgi:pentatricopeptide repeat protein